MKKSRGYWYLYTVHECPVCGYGEIYKERQTTPKPSKWEDRHKWSAYYDYCLERGG